MAKNRDGGSVKLLSAVTGTGAGGQFQNNSKDGLLSFQLTGTTSAGSGSAIVEVQVSQVDSPGTNDWIDAGTITLTLGTTSTTDGFVAQVPWQWIRGNVGTLSGTNATCTLYMGS